MPRTPLLLASLLLASLACTSPPLSERIVGTYIVREAAGYTTATFNADGTAEQVGHYPGQSPFVSRGRYSIVGDTVYLTPVSDTAVRQTAVPAVLHGDSLIMLTGDPNARQFVFVRSK